MASSLEWRVKELSRGCLSKVRFSTEEEASHRARKVKVRGKPLSFYLCRMCQGYHLTKRPQKSDKVVKVVLPGMCKGVDCENQARKDTDYCRKCKWAATHAVSIDVRKRSALVEVGLIVPIKEG